MKKKYLRSAATRKKQSEARKAYWSKKKSELFKSRLTSEMEKHIKAHMALIKPKTFIGSVLNWIGL